MEDEDQSLFQIARAPVASASVSGESVDDEVDFPRDEIVLKNGIAAGSKRVAADDPMPLEQELAGAIALQKISTRLIREKDLDSLYREIIAAAMKIMRSEMGSIQVFDPGRKELYLLASEQFHPDSAKFWEWVSVGEASSCGQAFERGRRIVVEDIEQCDFLAGTEDLDHYRKCGMGAVQSTPLVSRDGRPDRHDLELDWKSAHAPGEGELRLLDVRARQAADLIERTQAEQRRKLLVGELNHRVKNTLAIVQAIARQTFRGSDAPPDLIDSFAGRLDALASAHDLLTKAHWESTDLKDLVEEALETCGVTGRASVDGPPLRLASSSAVTFAMALHELCTNALKYGALSVDGGRVEINWTVTANGESRFCFTWQETGGPEVRAPKRRGFESRLIERALAGDLKGEAVLDFRADGVRFTLDAPMPAQGLPS